MSIWHQIICISLLIFGCGEKVEPKLVSTNRTLKVQSSHNWDTAEELRFMWTPPQGPKGNDAKWIVNDDIMLFTPDVSGEYTISLMVENMSGEVLGEEIFYYIAENSSEPSTTISAKTPKVEKVEEQSTKNTEIVKSPKTESNPKSTINRAPVKTVVDNRPYTIQVAAWPTMEEARKDQLSLKKYGFDAYTQRVFVKKKNAYWWRVRVGNFPTKDIALKVKNQLEKLRNQSVWIDRIDEK